jgi:hypothetical protein
MKSSAAQRFALAKRRLLYLVACLTPGFWAGTVGAFQAPPAPSARVAQKHALLVGCTIYPNNEGIPELYGPANDIPAWRALLTAPKGLAFPADNVNTLLGWPSDPAMRPTRANITKAIESVITRAGPNDMVFILFSMHGAQVPIPADQDPLDPKNFEPDGMDETILPADVTAGEVGPGNLIKDDEIGVWLDRIRAKGAHVLIIFDSCHSGTMTRGAEVERPRFVEPLRLGVKDKDLARAAEKSEFAVKKAKGEGRDLAAEERSLQTAKRPASDGSLVAFFAAQPFETEPELPFPEGAPQTREHYFGLLSYTLLQALGQRQSLMTYRDFARVVDSRYRALRGTRGPTPFCEGDLDREFLGMSTWPNRADVVLERTEQQLVVSAGELQGISGGSILAVRRPAGAAGDADEVIGYVRAESAGSSSAVVKPVAYRDKAAVGAQTLPTLGRCEVVHHEFGDMRVKLFAGESSEVRAAIPNVAKAVQDMINFNVSAGEAQWTLWSVTAKAAELDFGLARQSGDRILLIQGAGPGGESRQVMEKKARDAANVTVPRRVFGNYPAGEPKALAAALELDLPKVFRWQNVWRIAGNVASQASETYGLRLEIAVLKDRNDRGGGKLLDKPVLYDGQPVEIRLKNDGIEDLWVTVLYLDDNLGIEVFWAGSIRQGTALAPFPEVMKVENHSTGREGLVIFALPQRVQKLEPDYRFLGQLPLQTPEVANRDLKGAGDTPFAKLMSSAAFGGGTRGMERKVSTTPAIISQSWILLER